MKLSRGLVLALAMLLAACGGDADTGAETAEPSPTPAEATQPEAAEPGPDCEETDELTALDNEWEPQCIVTSGALTVTNDGKTTHTFTMAGSIDITLEPGKSEEVDVTDAAEPVGDTYFLCTIHPGMDGFLWVR
jgi:hypothetical protein